MGRNLKAKSAVSLGLRVMYPPSIVQVIVTFANPLRCAVGFVMVVSR